MNITRACGSPTPNTSVVRVSPARTGAVADELAQLLQGAAAQAGHVVTSYSQVVTSASGRRAGRPADSAE